MNIGLIIGILVAIVVLAAVIGFFVLGGKNRDRDRWNDRDRWRHGDMWKNDHDLNGRQGGQNNGQGFGGQNQGGLNQNGQGGLNNQGGQNINGQNGQGFGGVNGQNFNGQMPGSNANMTEVDRAQLEALAKYVEAQKKQAEAAAMAKEVRKIEMREKLETFKQTKESLKDGLKNQIAAKEWKSLKNVLNGIDKGNVGIYVIYNATKNKYYVGQAKQLYKRIRDHFKVEQMAIDFLSGDQMHIKTLEATEMDASYRLDHIEKTAIEIFNADGDGYNKSGGNL